MKKNLFFKVSIVLIFQIFFSQSFAQSKQEKKSLKRLQKLSNPKWLKINDKTAYFSHDLSASLPRVSFTSADQIGRVNNNQSKTQQFLYNKSGYDYDKLENKIIQTALFKEEIESLEIELMARCKGESIDNNDKLNNSHIVFRSISTLFLNKRELDQLREINEKNNFSKGIKVSDQIIMDNISRTINQICN
ncbi:MAG: hypothetical protein CMC79_01080 [Flavobacteriaceae bacterium]|nr:hypothetical protein [Flavobacteriaceae bacterium]|tara:strand:- start:25019 stop:25591 length:573 start_codon:yes stop_codon:yes gene_type:complete